MKLFALLLAVGGAAGNVSRLSQEWFYTTDSEDDLKSLKTKMELLDAGHGFTNLLIDNGFQWEEEAARRFSLQKFLINCFVESTQIGADLKTRTTGTTEGRCFLSERGDEGWKRQNYYFKIDITLDEHKGILFKPKKELEVQEKCSSDADGTILRRLRKKADWDGFPEETEASPGTICLVKLQWPAGKGEKLQCLRAFSYDKNGRCTRIDLPNPKKWKVAPLAKEVQLKSEEWSLTENFEATIAALREGGRPDDLYQELHGLGFRWHGFILPELRIGCFVLTNPMDYGGNVENALASKAGAQLRCERIKRKNDVEGSEERTVVVERSITLHENMRILFQPIWEVGIIEEKCRVRQGDTDFPEIPREIGRAREFQKNFGREDRNPSTNSICLSYWEWLNCNESLCLRLGVRAYDAEGNVGTKLRTWSSRRKFSDPWSVSVASLHEAKKKLAALKDSIPVEAAGEDLVDKLTAKGFQKLVPSIAGTFFVYCVVHVLATGEADPQLTCTIRQRKAGTWRLVPNLKLVMDIKMHPNMFSDGANGATSVLTASSASSPSPPSPPSPPSGRSSQSPQSPKPSPSPQSPPSPPQKWRLLDFFCGCCPWISGGGRRDRGSTSSSKRKWRCSDKQQRILKKHRSRPKHLQRKKRAKKSRAKVKRGGNKKQT